MRTLFLIAPNSQKVVTDFRSDCGVKMNGSSLVGTVLAGRFKILKKIEVDSFRAHDLLLDQTVMVRQALLSSRRDDDSCRQKVQRLALVRHPNFLNVLDVVCNKSSCFIITEHPQGHSITDLLKERSRFDVEDVLTLMTPLGGALDLAASFACCANSISVRWLFVEKRHSFAVDSDQRQLSEWASSLVKLDVWELLKRRKRIRWSLPTSIGRGGGSRKLAVRQAALVTYELLGGEKKNKESELKRWFQPINGLGDAGNAVLYRGLQGSPVFNNSGSFFQKFESAIQSGSPESRELPGSELSPQESSVSLSGTSAVLRRFDSDTRLLTTGILVVLVFAAFVLAVPFPEHNSNAVESTERVQTQGKLLPNTNFSALSKEVILIGKGSAGEITPSQATGIDHAVGEVSQKENPTAQMEAAASTPTPVLALTPEINHTNTQVAANLGSPADWEDHARPIGLNIIRARSSGAVRPKFVDVKMRLIALWHQSLRSERSRTWTQFWNLNKGERKKVGYTHRIGHRGERPPLN